MLANVHLSVLSSELDLYPHYIHFRSPDVSWDLYWLKRSRCLIWCWWTEQKLDSLIRTMMNNESFFSWFCSLCFLLGAPLCCWLYLSPGLLGYMMDVPTSGTSVPTSVHWSSWLEGSVRSFSGCVEVINADGHDGSGFCVSGFRSKAGSISSARLPGHSSDGSTKCGPRSL